MACKCKNRPCSCEDKGIHAAPPCGQGTVDCPGAEQCAEVFSAGCISYVGDSIVDIGINKGDRMDSILQRIALYLTNPGCIQPTSLCQSVLDLQSIYISPTIIKVGWLPSQTATQYTVEYKTSTGTVWFSNPSLLPTLAPTYTIGGLDPDTEYYIRVRTTCSSGICYSVTISVNTLSA